MMAQGQLDQSTSQSDFNATAFLVQQILNRANFATMVKVIACTNDGGLEPVGFVDVQPLVNQLDGQDNAFPHATVYGLPYLRIQGGSNGIICDPKPGDIGPAVFADRDISSVKSNKGQANPGSKRRNDMADGMYCGGMCNDSLLQYLRFAAAGIEIVSPVKITIRAPMIVLDGPVMATSTIDAAIDVTAAGVSLVNHLTTLVQPGMGMSGPPA